MYLYSLASVGDIAGFGCRDEGKRFESAWKALVDEEELVCAHSGAKLATLPRPNALIIDVSPH